MDINETLENLRGTYLNAMLDIKDCNPDPVLQFDKWLEDAVNAKCDEPNAFVLSTIKGDRPRGRVVLLKGIHENQFIFYTNYNSAKGDEIALHDKVSLTFLWLPLHRQVRIEGVIKKVEPKISDEYFHKRPRGSQLGAIASPQSHKVSSREELEKFFADVEKKFAGTEVLPRPAHWGGYGIEADYIEFWQGRNNRMHDRICYEQKNGKWELYRLAP
ncbi:pyridoxamine 5'-phosphate oxidase [Peredibacter starrii]|uniref:Pyridoxamine 5'-phosphate oxidase n=1 Tax=Peredibacter starrii TaxID=28202 RepID=A0AAX4HQ93_9BACT|nr:pyridoxamine 5'-phosphate oxidase [Peredibacter starrii]WPU65452.1 pyridoxamine 5'-phosphate oxidase [Peredibacter starrii]